MRMMDVIVYSSDPTPFRILVKNWATHRINTAVVYILITEVLGISNVVFKTTTEHTTKDSFRMLSIAGAEVTTRADLDMELWASAAFDEFQRRIGSLRDDV